MVDEKQNFEIKWWILEQETHVCFQVRQLIHKLKFRRDEICRRYTGIIS